MLVSLVALVFGLLVGFGAGLFSFRVKSRWCPVCGARTWREPASDSTETHR